MPPYLILWHFEFFISNLIIANGGCETMEGNIASKLFFEKLKDKTQMTKTMPGPNQDIVFTNRLSHTKDVISICEQIVKVHNLENCVNNDRLLDSAFAHDVGHTPFGHAGEEQLDSLFLSKDKLHFSETYPGVFRHNINSLRVLIENQFFNNEKSEFYAVLIDSIVKHTGVFPKNYIYCVFKENNIIKLDYLFERVKFKDTIFFNKFISTIQPIACDNASAIPLAGRKETRGCKKGKLCYLRSPSFHLSSYLMYPFPLTIEGTVLYYSDEIACICSDICDFFKILFLRKRAGENIDSLISLTRICSKLNWIESFCEDNLILKKINELFELVKTNVFSESIKKNIDLKISLIRDYLVNSLEINENLLGNGPDSVIINNGCQPIFSLRKDVKFIYSSIKSTIYEDLHSFNEVELWNNFGKECILALVDYFKDRINIFLQCLRDVKDYLKVGSIVNSFYRMLDMTNPSKESNPSTKDALKEMQKELSKGDFSIDDFLKFSFVKNAIDRTPLLKYHDKQYVIDLVINLLKREICYFIARQTDSEIIGLVKRFGLVGIISKKVPKSIKYVKPLIE